MKLITVLLIALSSFSRVQSQGIGIGTNSPDASAALDITATNKGLLIPRMTTAAISSISNPAKGLMLYDSVKNLLLVNMGTAAAPDWEPVVAGSGWSLVGNKATNPAINFIGTTDSVPLLFRINSHWAGFMDSVTGNTFLGYSAGQYTPGQVGSTAFGYQALDSNKSGGANAAFGVQTMSGPKYAGNPPANNNTTAIGYQALNRYWGNDCTAIGYQAFFSAGSGGGGFSTTATGYQAEYRGGVQNTATGALALYSPQSVSSTGGSGCTASGVRALYNNSSFDNSPGVQGGNYNTATGFEAMYKNVAGIGNTACGYQALYKNYYGNYNSGFGIGAMYSNSVHASENTAMGVYSLISTTNSQENTAVGYDAGHSYDNGNYNCFIGAETDANGPGYTNSIAIGHGTLVTGSNMMRVGNGATVSIGGPVGWSTISDGRVKRNIQENVPGLAFINKLKPISYTIDLAAIDRITRPAAQKQQAATLNAGSGKNETTSRPEPYQMTAARSAKEQIVYTGFVAQQVEQAAQSLHYAFSGVDAARNDKDLYSLRYDEFVAPLTKAVQELAALHDQLKKQNEQLVKQREKALQELDELEKKLN